MRTLVDIPDEDIERLDALAAEGRRSRAAEIREAVRLYLVRRTSGGGIEQAFGAWKDRTDIGDGVDYQRRLRAGWTRPWDPEYDAVRAEFPDLFDEAGDRERDRYRT